MTSSPLVSVIIATYNRSNVLRYAIASVIEQTVRDWELLVIGDCCTDDTAEVVASFNDQRIRFVNLAENVGEQSGPNNRGLELARGRFVSFLNHDDLWFPDHLERTLSALEDTGADLVFPLAAWRFRPIAAGAQLEWRLAGASPDGRFSAVVEVPATLWVFRRALLDRIGPWRSARECRGPSPSRDWIVRAAAGGADIRALPFVTILIIASTTYGRGSYARRADELHREAAEQLRSNPNYRQELVTSIALAMHVSAIATRPLRTHAYSMLQAVARKILAPLGTTPAELIERAGYRRAHTLINSYREHRGLGPLPAQENARNA